MTPWHRLGSRKEQTPLQKLSNGLGLRRTPLRGKELRQVLRELEQMRRERPADYQYLLESHKRMVELAEAMHPRQEEHRRLVATEHPSDRAGVSGHDGQRAAPRVGQRVVVGNRQLLSRLLRRLQGELNTLGDWLGAIVYDPRIQSVRDDLSNLFGGIVLIALVAIAAFASGATLYSCAMAVLR